MVPEHHQAPASKRLQRRRESSLGTTQRACEIFGTNGHETSRLNMRDLHRFTREAEVNVGFLASEESDVDGDLRGLSNESEDI